MTLTSLSYEEKKGEFVAVDNAHLTPRSPSENWSGIDRYQVDYFYDYGDTPVLYKFDLTSIPPNAEIVDAYLETYRRDTSDDTQEGLTRAAYKVTSSWDGSSVTYNTKPNWDSVNLGSLTEPLREGDYRHLGNNEMVSLVSDWVSGTTPNYGIVTSRTVTTELGAGHSWHSDVLTMFSDIPPKLVVHYREKPTWRQNSQLDLSKVGRMKSSYVEWKANGYAPREDSGDYIDHYISLNSTANGPYTLSFDMRPDSNSDGGTAEYEWFVNGVSVGNRESLPAEIDNVLQWKTFSIDVTSQLVEGENHIEAIYRAGGDRGGARNVAIEDGLGEVFFDQYGFQFYGSYTSISNDGANNAAQMTNNKIRLETRVSKDGGSTWSNWVSTQPLEPIPNLSPGDDLRNTLLEYTLVTEDVDSTQVEDVLKYISFHIEGYRSTFRYWSGSEWEEVNAYQWDGNQWNLLDPKAYVDGEWM